MNSFYGGKQGLTYNIVLRFGSVALMVTAFSQGGAYTKVNYGLYVIIDTISINRDYTNKENGLLFRRGFDYSKEYVAQGNTDWQTWLENGVGGGAIYVGQISGPMGKSPEIRLSGIDGFPSGANITTVDSSIVFKPATTAAISDQFQLKYTNVSTVVGSDQNASTQLVSQIGLQIPYSNIILSATTVDNYGSEVDHNGSSWTPGESGSFIHKIGNLLYQDLQIAIPKGVKGDSVKILVQDVNVSPYKTLFKIIPTVTNYDNSALGNSSSEIYPITLESLAVDKLKLVGDYLYYHTSKNRNVDNRATSIDNLLWNPLGSPGGQFHIYNYFQAQDNTKSSALNLLYAAYPNGIDLATEDPTKAGWVVAIKYNAIIEGLTETITELYAYDYTSNSTTVADRWFPLANFSSMMITPETVVILKERNNTSSNPIPDGNYSLAVNGLWFLQLDLIAKSENWSLLNKAQEEEE